MGEGSARGAGMLHAAAGMLHAAALKSASAVAPSAQQLQAALEGQEHTACTGRPWGRGVRAHLVQGAGPHDGGGYPARLDLREVVGVQEHRVRGRVGVRRWEGGDCLLFGVAGEEALPTSCSVLVRFLLGEFLLPPKLKKVPLLPDSEVTRTTCRGQSGVWGSSHQSATSQLVGGSYSPYCILGGWHIPSVTAPCTSPQA